MSKYWTDTEIDTLKALATERRPIAEIAKLMGRTEMAIESRAVLLGLSVSRSRSREVYHPREHGESYTKHDLMKRNLLHLLDLKRAGHSPRFTEFKISPDDSSSIRTQPTPAFSSSSCALVW